MAPIKLLNKKIKYLVRKLKPVPTRSRFLSERVVRNTLARTASIPLDQPYWNI
jgi:hypothetical protein